MFQLSKLGRYWNVHRFSRHHARPIAILRAGSEKWFPGLISSTASMPLDLSRDSATSVHAPTFDILPSLVLPSASPRER